MQDDNLLATDLLHGARAIADFLGISERACRHQISAGNVPVSKMGRLIVARKSVLRERFTPTRTEAAA